MGDWRIAYKFNYLYSLVNEKRIDRGEYQMITDPELRAVVKKEMKSKGQDALTTIKTLINEVRDGRKL